MRLSRPVSRHVLPVLLGALFGSVFMAPANAAEVDRAPSPHGRSLFDQIGRAHV